MVERINSLKSHVGVFSIMLLLFSSCQSDSNSTIYKNSLQIPLDGLLFTINQRDTIEIPSEKGNVILWINDITIGQTKV